MSGGPRFVAAAQRGKEQGERRVKGKEMISENVGLSRGENESRDLAAKSHYEKYVLFLSVEAKAAVAISEKLSSFARLESEDYKKIFRATTEERSRWECLLGRIRLDRLKPNVPEKILPYSYCNLLLSQKQKNYETCPKLYDLITEYTGSVVIAKYSKELCERLYSNKVL